MNFLNKEKKIITKHFNLANDCTSFISRIGLYNCGRCPRALHGASSNMRSNEFGTNGGEVLGSGETSSVVSYT